MTWVLLVQSFSETVVCDVVHASICGSREDASVKRIWTIQG